jgi:hypothetical protein
VTTDPVAESLRARLQAAVGAGLDVREPLGAGGFARVFRAHDPRLGRDVAIKVLDPDGHDGRHDAEILREARLMAGVEHPHIVPLYDAEARDGLLYLVMRLVPGRTLAGAIHECGRLPAAEAARLAQEVASALAAAHARGVVHRDVKPANILLDGDGHALVTDFGVAVATAAEPGGAAGESTGTLRYMSPEQALGEAVDGRSDVYALGVVLYEMLTGTLPLDARSDREQLARLIAAPAPSVAESAPETPAGLVALVAAMLAKAPDARPTAADVVARLAAVRTPEGLRSPAEVQRRARWRRVRLTALIGGTGVVVAGLLIAAANGFIGVFFDGSPEPRLSASGSAIPAALIGAARADGLLRDGEVPRYAFVPSGETDAEALLITDSAVVRLSPAAPRRLPRGRVDMQVRFVRGAGRVKDDGLLVARFADGPRDTLYRGLRGRDLLRLMSALSALEKPPVPRPSARDR